MPVSHDVPSSFILCQDDDEKICLSSTMKHDNASCLLNAVATDHDLLQAMT